MNDPGYAVIPPDSPQLPPGARVDQPPPGYQPPGTPPLSDAERAELEQLRAMREELQQGGQLLTAREAAEPGAGQDDDGAATLTAAEVREFRRLQREAKNRADKDREARKVEELKRSGPTHYVHLADGQILMMSGGTIGTHHRVDDGTPDGHLVAVAAAFEMSPAECERQDARRLAAL